MRYKVRAPDERAYEALLRALSDDEAVEVFAASPRRRIIGTGELPEPARAEIRACGGTISEDFRYDLEAP
jgi:hypothetical protein